MPQQAYTFTPEYSEDATGEQVFTGEGQLTAGHRGGQVFDQAYAEDELTGERLDLISDNDYQADEDYQETESYEELLVEAMPDLPDALAWAGQVLSPEQIEDFNARMDSGDPDDYMEFLENIYEMYLEAEGIEEEDDSDAYEPEDETDEVTQEEVNEVISELADSEPLGQEFAMPYLQMAVENQSEHPCLSEMCALTAEFHTGNVSYEAAMDQLVSKYPLTTIKHYLNYLNEN